MRGKRAKQIRSELGYKKHKDDKSVLRNAWRVARGYFVWVKDKETGVPVRETREYMAQVLTAGKERQAYQQAKKLKGGTHE